MTPCSAIHGIHGPHERPRDCHERLREQACAPYMNLSDPPTGLQLDSLYNSPRELRKPAGRPLRTRVLVRSVLNIHEIREWPRECALGGPVGGPVDGLAPRGDVEGPAASTG
eukprot:gene15177-biopygen6253